MTTDRRERLRLYGPDIAQAALAAFGFSEWTESGGRLRGPSPLRLGSTNKSAFSLSLAHGGWHDRPAAESGDALELVARLHNLDRRRDFPELLALCERYAGLSSAGPEASAAAAAEQIERRRAERAAAQQKRALALAEGGGAQRINGPCWRDWTPERVGREFDRLAAAAVARQTDAEAEAEFLRDVYSVADFPADCVAPWTYPRSVAEVDPEGKFPGTREGLLYLARDERGRPEGAKFKTFARTKANRKRASRGVWGNKGALLGADLLPKAEGGIVVVVAGEEKALAGNAWAKRLGAGVVFVSSLFGEGFSSTHGPAQAKRIKEAGPARIVIAGDADAAGEKFNDAWRSGLLAADWPAERIGAVVWPEGSKAGYDVNDKLAAHGAEALFALIQSAQNAPAPPAPAIRGKALRARKTIPANKAFLMPEPIRHPLRLIRRNLRERLEGMAPGEKLLIAAGTGTGKTTAAARAAARELKSGSRAAGSESPRVLIAAPKNVWPDWRAALEEAGLRPTQIAELPGRDADNCRHAGFAASLREKGQNVSRLLCGRNMAGPNGETAQGGEEWTPCASIAKAKAAGQGVKAQTGCAGCSGGLGYILRYEQARRAQVVITTPERLFGPGFDRLEGEWPFTLHFVDEGVDRHLLPSRRVSAAAAEEWKARLAKLDPTQDLEGFGPLSLAGWLDRLLALAPHRAKALEEARLAKLSRAAERDAWLAWAAEEWPEEEGGGGGRAAERLEDEISTLLSAISERAKPLPFEKARSAGDAPTVAFREYFSALRRDLADPAAEPWLVSQRGGGGGGGGSHGPAWLIGEPSAARLSILAEPARKVAILDATPSSVARAILAAMDFETFEATPPDNTRIIQVLGKVNGTGAFGLQPEPPDPEGATSEAIAAFEARLAAWKSKRKRHEERLAEIAKAFNVALEDVALVTHKARADGFELLPVGTTFGRHRGTNALAGAKALIVDGRSEPPAEEMARERRLLSRTLAAFGAPEPELYPLIAASQPDEREGLETARRYVQYVGRAGGEARAVSVFSTGDALIDGWILERRERETVQTIGRLRGPDRAERDEAPPLAFVATDDPLGMVGVDEFVEWRQTPESWTARRDALNAKTAAETAKLDAERIADAERAAAELLLAGEKVSQTKIAKRIGVSATTLRRAFERAGRAPSELCQSPEENLSTLYQYKNTKTRESGEPRPIRQANPSAGASGPAPAESAEPVLPAAAAESFAETRERVETRAERQKLIARLSSAWHDLDWPNGAGARWGPEIRALNRAFRALIAANDFEDGIEPEPGRAGSTNKTRRRVRVLQGPRLRHGPERAKRLDEAAALAAQAFAGYMAARAVLREEEERRGIGTPAASESVSQSASAPQRDRPRPQAARAG